MLLVLLVLGAACSYATWGEQHPTDAAAGSKLAALVIDQIGAYSRVLIVVRDTDEDQRFAKAIADRLQSAGGTVVQTVHGQPSDARQALASIADAGGRLDVIVGNHATAAWTVFEDFDRKFPTLGSPPVVAPSSYRWATFLTPTNLLNLATQISVTAIMAVGMTLVIITGGIDLSVGSLVALSSVCAALLIRDRAGAEAASASALVLCSLAGIAACAAVGAFSGLVITLCRIPAFIVTLAMMMTIRGLAFMLTGNQSVNQLPDSYVWLGRGADLFGIPNAVVLMAAAYGAAWVLLNFTVPGRYIYAVGSNYEGARLSGVPVRGVLIMVYTVCATLAGLGGIVQASLLKSGSPFFGVTYELQVIAAVVVGGTSLQGGQGRITDTLLGALVIAVIQNGMNLMSIESNQQMVVFGMVILGAVLLDRLKQRGTLAASERR